jgi:uncharacterized protein
MKVAITGATGFIGSRLVARLQAEGHPCLVLTRDPQRARQLFPQSEFPTVEIVFYEPMQSGEWQGSLSSCDGVVNLAGAPIAERWTASYQQTILDSRKVGTQKLVEAIAQANPKPQVLVNASAIGYYGTSETATLDETSPAGNDFLAQVCQAWEAEAAQVMDAGVRLVIMRLGIVLGMGGAIARMVTPFKLFAGGPIGSGKQWFSWIHREDVVSLIVQALTNPSMTGVYNATAPQPLRMLEFCQVMGEVMNRPSWLPVPAFAIEALLGDGAVVVLEGQQVLPKRTQESGFRYEYPTAKLALKEVLEEG